MDGGGSQLGWGRGGGIAGEGRGGLTRGSGGGQAQQRQQHGGQRGPGHDGGAGAGLGTAGRPSPPLPGAAAEGGRGPGSPNPRPDPAARCPLARVSKAIFKTFHVNRINFRLAKILQKIVQRMCVALQPASLNINVLCNARAIIKAEKERWWDFLNGLSNVPFLSSNPVLGHSFALACVVPLVSFDMEQLLCYSSLPPGFKTFYLHIKNTANSSN